MPHFGPGLTKEYLIWSRYSILSSLYTVDRAGTVRLSPHCLPNHHVVHVFPCSFLLLVSQNRAASSRYDIIKMLTWPSSLQACPWTTLVLPHHLLAPTIGSHKLTHAAPEGQDSGGFLYLQAEVVCASDPEKEVVNSRKRDMQVSVHHDL